MGSRNSNKVKNYVRRKNAISNITTVLFSLIFLIVSGLIGGVLAMSVYYSQVLASDADMKTLVSITDENWGDQKKLDEQIIAVMKEKPEFGQVLFLDDQFNIIHGVDYIGLLETTEKEQAKRLALEDEDYDAENVAHREFSKINLNANAVKEFGTRGIYRGISIVPVKGFESARVLTLTPWNFPFSSELLTWAEKDIYLIPDWIVYKTAVAGVNVCCRYISVWNNLDSHMFSIGFFIFTIALILFIFSGFFYIFSMARRRRYGNKIIYTDPVTGGFNRDYFINKALKGARRRRQYAVVQFRLEKYGNYCTAYGLKQGERLLEMIYWAAKEYLEKDERLAHLENADYAMLLHYERNDQLEARLKEMVEGFNGAVKRGHLVFEAGIYPLQSRKADMTEVLTSAGLALSKAELQNANIAWFNEEMKQEQLWERRVEDDMEKALARHEFQVYLQPKYSTKTERLAAAEALVRWIHPELRFISPGKFIPIFERNGFILKLDDYMLREIARLQAGWMKEGKPLVPISVNVSRAHFSMDDLAEHICSIVDEYKVPHKFIELELTESAFFDDKRTLLMTVKKLKAYGFRISMDDFGAGYSSLNSLKELPLDIIKLDAEFFRGIDDVKRANAIVSDTIALAKKLGMQIVAEGIETREQVDFLAAQDCDLIQGFFFAKPLPVSEFVERAYS